MARQNYDNMVQKTYEDMMSKKKEDQGKGKNEGPASGYDPLSLAEKMKKFKFTKPVNINS